tara:strand:+ start:134103 stop:134210 length:108 start_codon:yes stop_codon:yes gene_type:complete
MMQLFLNDAPKIIGFFEKRLQNFSIYSQQINSRAG